MVIYGKLPCPPSLMPPMSEAYKRTMAAICALLLPVERPARGERDQCIRCGTQQEQRPALAQRQHTVAVGCRGTGLIPNLA